MNKFDGVSRIDLERWIREFADQVVHQHQALSELDAATGDADHGSNMERGMSSLPKSMNGWNSQELPGPFLKNVGMHIVSTVGGSSGALYGTIFLRMARVVDQESILNRDLLVSAFEAAVQGIKERGKVEEGDKTMLDALAPAVRMLGQSLLEREQPAATAFQLAADAAESGRDATANMVARRGKSSYAREKSRGSVDPGAASIAILIRAAAQSISRP